jgi:predicted nucleic acid-binding protein
VSGLINVKKVVFDTCAATFLIKDDKRMRDIEPDIAGAKKYTSVVTRMELRAEPGMSAEKLKRVEDFIADTSVIPLVGTVEKVATTIRREWRPNIKLPDCIVAATAIALGATLLTGDEGLKDLVWPGYTVHPL